MTKTATVPVFDIGGVLLDWNPRYLYRKLFDDEAAMEEFLATVCTSEWNRRMDGGMSFAEGIAELLERFPDQSEMIEAYRDRWPEMIPAALDDTVEIFETLKTSGRPLYAITNFAAETFVQARAMYPFLNRFDGIVVSGEIKALKPGPEIYRCLLEQYDLRAEDCLFIDDVQENVDGAKAVGMHAVRFTNAETLASDLKGHGLL